MGQGKLVSFVGLVVSHNSKVCDIFIGCFVVDTMLFLVGSSRNCFGSRTSDADMCLMVTEGEVSDVQ